MRQRDKYKNLAYILLEDPKFLYNFYRIRTMTRFKLTDEEVRTVMRLLVDRDFLAEAQQYYQERQRTYPSETAKRALREIKLLETEPTVYRRQPMIEPAGAARDPFPNVLPQTYERIWDTVDKEKLRRYCEDVWGVPISSEAAGYMARVMARQIAGFKLYLPLERGRPLTLQDMWNAASQYFG